MRSSTYKNRIYTIVAIIVLIILWDIVSRAVASPILVPSPKDTLFELINIIRSKDFLGAVLHTVERSIIGFLIAFFSAMFLGVFSGMWKPIYYLLNPLVLIMKSTPTMSIILLALIWLNTESAPILIGILVIFPIIYGNVVTGIENVDPKLIEMSNVFRVSKLRMIRELYIPSVMPFVLSACSTALGLNIKVVIAAEVLSQPIMSIGTSLNMEKVYLNTAGVFAWTLVAIVVSAIFEYLLFLISKRIEKWK